LSTRRQRAARQHRSDLDGGYGREQTPLDVATIADLAGIPAILARRGYSSADIERIMSGNWIAFLEHAWK
jgi:membrane dipeptidase